MNSKVNSPQAATDVRDLRRIKLKANGAFINVIEQGSGPAVMFLHGFPDTAQTWRSQMRAVAQAGYRAVALDLRGFGSSYSPEDTQQYSALHIVGDLVGVLDALSIRSAVLVGHDWGADHAQRAMLMRPDRFSALVSLSIPFVPRGELSAWDTFRQRGLGELYYAFDMMKPGAEREFEPAERTIPNILYWLSASPVAGTGWDPIDPARHMLRPAPLAVPDWADPEYVRHTISAFEGSGFHGGLNHYRAAQETFDLMPAFKDAVIDQPSLYIWGAEDGLCKFFHPEPPTLAEMRRNQPGLIDVLRFENVGHWIQHEAADRLNVELIAFLRRIEWSLAGVKAAHGGVANRSQDSVALTALMAASALGQTQRVRDLLASGADVHAVEPCMGATAIHKAAQSGNTEVLSLLLDHGAFVDQQSPVLGHTALMDAVLHKHKNAVELLLQRGARTTIKNHWQQTALELAQHDGLDEIAQLIASKDETDAVAIRALELVNAVKGGNLTQVEELIASGASVNERVPIVGGLDDNYTPLGIAARDGHADIVRVLLDAGANPREEIGLMKGTPLHEASYFGNEEILRAMTERSRSDATQAPDLDAQGPYNGFTALHDAIWHGHAAAVRALVDAGVRKDIETQGGLTPHALAMLYGYAEIAQVLSEADSRAPCSQPRPHRHD